MEPYVIGAYDLDDIGRSMRDGTWFTSHLLRLCAKADKQNLERIRLGFPEVVAAYESWRDS